MQLYFEDFQVGQVDEFGAYPVDREEVIAFASKFDPQSYHLSDEAAAKSIFGRLSASAIHTLAMCTRLMTDRAKETGFHPEAGLGMQEMRITRPVYPGDTLSIRTEVVELRPSNSRPDCGIVSMLVQTLNQDGEVVMRYGAVTLFKTRAAS
jgi:acyl dehydratase